jgi:neutral ceramidase
MNETLYAGISRRIISPPKGIYLIGYGNRSWGNRGIRDDLTATALALQSDKTQVVIIACDLLTINEFTVKKIEKLFHENILICCSHTHSGPICYADVNSKQKNIMYVNFLTSQLAAVAKEAMENLSPVKLAWGSGDSDIAVNRRERLPNGKIIIGKNPDGVVDKTIGILQVQDAHKRPMVNLVNLSCHNVVFGPKNLMVSADWAGSMRNVLEKETGIPSMFIQGATADLNPNPSDDWDASEAVENLGIRVAEQVFVGLDHLTSFLEVPLNFHKTNIWIPLEAEANTPFPPDIYKKRLQDKIPVPIFLIDPLLNARYPWKSRVEKRGDYWSVPMAAGFLQIGEMVWISLGAEVFNQIGINIKSITNSPFPFFSSVTNGSIGYLPTKAEHALGGYEVDISPYFYRYPGRLQDQAERITIEDINKHLGNLLPND